MVPDINGWGVLVAAVSTLVVGSIWYTPKVFGTYWMRTAKIDPEGGARSALWPIAVTFLVSLVSAWVLAGSAVIAQGFYGGSFLGNSVVTALILWAGFTASRFITHDAFEGRPVGLTVLNCAHELVTFVVMAVVIGLFGT